MFPTYTVNYWIGLRSNKTGWPAFDWMNAAYLPPKRYRDRWAPALRAAQISLDHTSSTAARQLWIHCSHQLARCSPHRFYEGYEHWGGDVQYSEPDNRAGNEFCAVANYSQAYRQAWGWSDTHCNQQFGFMCRVDAPSVYSFTSKMSIGYVLNTMPMMQTDAEATCIQQGGHLVSFRWALPLSGPGLLRRGRAGCGA
jgi:hypothetical protein